MRLVRNAVLDANPDLRGRKHHFTIENSPAVSLEIMDEQMEAAGWKNDDCPVYDEGVSCGYWIDISEVDQFKSDYKKVKANICAHIAAKSISIALAEQEKAQLAKGTITGRVFKHRNEAMSERFVVSIANVFIEYGDAKCRRFEQVKPEQITANPECFELVEQSRAYEVIPGVVEDDDYPLMDGWVQYLLDHLFIVPELPPQLPPEIQKMEGVLHGLYQTLNVPDLRVEAGRLIGFWMDNGEEKTIILYVGDDIGMAHDIAAKMNADEIKYWDEQQRAEQAAEARNERYFEEGNGAHAFYYEDMERWGR